MMADGLVPQPEVQGIGASPAERSRFDDCALVLSDSVRTQVVRVGNEQLESTVIQCVHFLCIGVSSHTA
jgi:hypothetical protein